MLFSCCNLLWFWSSQGNGRGIKLLCLLTPGLGCEAWRGEKLLNTSRKLQWTWAKVTASKTVYFYLTLLCPNSLSICHCLWRLFYLTNFYAHVYVTSMRMKHRRITRFPEVITFSIYFVFSYLFLHRSSYSGLAVTWSHERERERESERERERMYGVSVISVSEQPLTRLQPCQAAGMLRNLKKNWSQTIRENKGSNGNKRITRTNTQDYFDVYNNINLHFHSCLADVDDLDSCSWGWSSWLVNIFIIRFSDFRLRLVLFFKGVFSFLCVTIDQSSRIIIRFSHVPCTYFDYVR